MALEHRRQHQLNLHHSHPGRHEFTAGSAKRQNPRDRHNHVSQRHECRWHRPPAEGTNSQAQPQLQNNNLYAGIMFYGLAVTNCWVESSTSLTTTALWTPVTNFTFPASPMLIFDANPVGPNGSRFYRAVELPQWRKNLQGGGFSHAT